MSATMTRDQLVDTLRDRRGAFFVTVTAETDPRMRKTGNPYVGAVKRSVVNGLLNWIYENAVNRQRIRENQPFDGAGEVEHFTPHPRKWGTRLKRADGTITPLVEHKGQFYLELKVERSLGHEYRLAGKVLDRSLVEPFLPDREEGARQEVENPVILRDYSVENVQQITMDGIVYEIV
jgi:hypothetical protein